MLVKLAFLGSALVGKAIGAATDHVTSAAIGSLNPLDAAFTGNLHDVANLMTSKSNAFGKTVQKLVLSDTIIAAKKASEGQVYANRKLLPTLLYATQPLKALALYETNTAVGKLPKAITKSMFDGNKLNVERLKGTLGFANALDRTAFTAQVAVPTLVAGKEYENQRLQGKSVKESLKSGLKSGLTTAAVVDPLLALPRKAILAPAAEAHKALSKDLGYGYQLLEDSARSAEKSLNRPKFLNYSKAFYTTPEKNLRGISRLPGDTFKKAMGQKLVTRYDPKEGYIYEGQRTTPKTKPLDQHVRRAKQAIHKLDGILAGHL